MFEQIKFPVTVCILCYGSHAALARRCLGSLREKTDPSQIKLRIGLNAVASETHEIAREAAAHFPGTVIHDSQRNIFKLPMMRRLFSDPPIDTEWIVWFDDDSHVRRADWLTSLAVAIEAHPEVSMWGKTCFVEVGPEFADFVRSAPWHQGIPLAAADSDPEKVRLSFVLGGWWSIRTRCLRALNWPDPRLIHFHDDFLLGEALRQNGFSIQCLLPGVAIDDAYRRAPQYVPCGFRES